MEKENGEEKPQKGKGRKRIFAGVNIVVVVLCTVIVLGNQSIVCS